MNKLQETIEKYGLPIADKIQGNRYISAITNGFSMILPIIMMGAIFTLLSSLQIGPYQDFVSATGLKTVFSYAGSFTTDLLALFTVYAIAYQFTIGRGYQKDAAFVAPISMVMFLILIPMGVSKTTEAGEVVNIGAALSTGFLGSKGIFTAILVGIISPTIYLFFIERKIVIKMPDSVPPTVAKSFSALIPGFVLLFIFSLIRYGFSFTSFGDFNSWLYALLEKPLAAITNSPVSFIILIFVCQLLWSLGIHGYMVIRPFLQMVYLPLAVDNLAAYAAGETIPNIICYYNWATFVAVGGCGGLVGLAILMAFCSKSQRYKTLGKISLPSVICNINEPVIFGAPIVLNPVFFIPFLFVPIVSFILSYVLQLTGILPYLSGVALPLGTPVLLYGWLEGGFAVLVMQVVIILLQVIMYYPFFKVADKQALLEES
jgi:PTS system cellobiose-specific IIC component